MSEHAPATSQGRVAWLDLARAVSIILVVLYHVAVSGGADLLGDGRAAAWWASANLALIPLRMPLFFLVAGLLAAGALHRSWPRVLRPRVLDMLWPYVLWSLLFAATGWPRYAPEDPLGFVRGEIAGLFVVGSPYWFIAALPVFFVLSRLLRAHKGVLLAVTLVLYAAAPVIQESMERAEMWGDLVYGVFQLTDNALWYAAGFALRSTILAVGERPRPVLGLGLTAVFCPLALIVLRAELPLPLSRGLELVASMSGIGACIALLPLLARLGSVARAGSFVGSRTLVIYLVHPIVLNLVVVAWRRADGLSLTAGPAGELLVVPAVAVMALLAAVGMQAVIDRWGPRWLIELPRVREMRNSSARTAGHPRPR
ncbi:acyltransferase family protein [Brachybacterium sp. GCM10030267]|uniref:acyltransferase family protein n=1 Tax=unclassified Brachybacterium TaxID=2623841 RepID=UPI0036203152